MVFALVALAGLVCFSLSYIFGHQMFGSSNVVPWGMPIVLAIYLIGLSAGSLILSSLTYVFGREEFRPIARMAVLLAIVLIFGAMISIAVDLGRPEKFWRLFMFFYLNNMTSMFAINGILYGGYFVISLVYMGIILANQKKASKFMEHLLSAGQFWYIWAPELYSASLLPENMVFTDKATGISGSSAGLRPGTTHRCHHPHLEIFRTKN